MSSQKENQPKNFKRSWYTPQKHSNKIKSGVCPRCSRKITDGTSTCIRCKAIGRKKAKQRVAQRRKLGLCIFCGRKPKKGSTCERCKNRIRKRYLTRKAAVFNHYGKRCACCGETEEVFLTIDHINGGGRKHKREAGFANIHDFVFRNNFPDYFQILCFNCNQGKFLNGGICPHKSKPTC